MTICDHSWQVSKGSINFPARDIKTHQGPRQHVGPPVAPLKKRPPSHLSHLVLVLVDSPLFLFHVCGHFHLVYFPDLHRFFFLAQSCAWNAMWENKVTEDDFQTFTSRITEGVKCSDFVFLYLIGGNETELNFISDCWLNRRKSSGCIGPVSKSITIIKEYLKQTQP